MFNSVVSEIVVMKIIRVKVVKDFVIEFAMTVAFILSATLLPLSIGLIVYAAMLVLYGTVNFRTLGAMIRRKTVDSAKNSEPGRDSEE